MTLGTRLRNLVFASPIYRLTLSGRPPKELLATPPDLWPGDTTRAEDLMAAPFLFGQPPASGERVPWFMASTGEAARAELHGFSWLRDLRTLATEPARFRARSLISSWVEAQRRWDGLAWRPDVLGTRLAHWLSAYGFLTASGDEAFRGALLVSLGRQAKHLARVAAKADPDARILLAAKGLIYTGIALPSAEAYLDGGIKLLLRELERQVLPDGGHFQRSPTIQVEVLRLLVDLRAALTAAHREVPGALQGAIDRMSPMTRLFRHGDGRLALFNGGLEGDDRDLTTLLAQTGSRARASVSAPHSGFQRLAAGRTMLIADVGAPPPPAADAQAHAGTLSFELSVGKDRLVVNCGAAGDGDPAWRQALAGTAAHSTLSVNEANSSSTGPGGRRGRRPITVVADRREGEGAFWLETSHDGYRETFGLIHHRHLYLSDDGSDLRGLDRLEGQGNGSFALRFHLHPLVTSSEVQSGSQVLLRLPGGAGWKFLASGARLALEDSVYRGSGRSVRRCRQIVLSGAIEPGETIVKWAFKKEAGDRS
jgi:uncharacterized heparinase superfamily protein